MEVTSTVTMAPHSALNVPGVVVGGTVVSESIGSFVCVVVSDTGPQALFNVSEAGYAESGLEFGLGLAVFVLLLVLIRRGMRTLAAHGITWGIKMLEIVIGKPGDGKSLISCMEVVEELNRSERCIVTNLPLDLVELAVDCHEHIVRPIDLKERVLLLEDEQVRDFFLYEPG